MSPEQRRRVPGLKPERADIIVAGLAVAAELLDRVSAKGVTVSGYGLREGLLLEMLALT
jgi:exopolyphosphatase/guanosine-5'-triphosphate,3'-diphosphate pyrophosphatase